MCVLLRTNPVNKLCLLLALLVSLSIQAKESAKVYRSFDAEYDATLTVVPASEEGEYYLNYKGFEHHYDGHTLLYKKQKNDDWLVGVCPDTPMIFRII